MNGDLTVEICVGDLESALAAEQGGADRIELCDNLSVGGTTPSAGTIAVACRRLKIPVHVLIRPRAGDFIPSQPELDAMRFDIDTARSLGASGVVFGLLRPNATIDEECTAELIALARPMTVTFHKAFDQTPNLEQALDSLIALGVDRVLTSGGITTAVEGIDTLKRLVERSHGRIKILVGGRLSADNLTTIIAHTRAQEVHFGSAVARTMFGSTTRAPGDGSEVTWSGVDAGQVRDIVDLVKIHSRAQPSF
jgi:copper homeostasis protein